MYLRQMWIVNHFNRRIQRITCINKALDLIIIIAKTRGNNTNVLQTADRGLDETAYDVSHVTALLPLYIEIVATASQLVDTHLYLNNIKI